ncbi:hypothetical protein DBR06_SOUSAS7110043, partial [Sousa chinensis]
VIYDECVSGTLRPNKINLVHFHYLKVFYRQMSGIYRDLDLFLMCMHFHLLL